ncbi:hypothetical protein [Geothrix paludis]|uniref:hypothetical protein n=1 Tax=Geothrix paludis TaxID=2922722 RepID=UPI001FAE475A|nr:hypothetical protein [Geothrix paludis]
MHIEITPYTAAHEEAVRAFNTRLAAANLDPNLYTFHFTESHVPKWLPRREGFDLYQEYFVAVDEQGGMHGGYGLKHQPFLLKGEYLVMQDYQNPISEGIADRTYAMVGAKLYWDALRSHPHMWGLGIGGLHIPMAKFLLSAGWQTTPVPFWFRVVHPNAFLRNITILRNTRLRRTVFDVLRFSGLGWLGIKTLFGLRRSHRPSADVSYEIVPEFSEWTDAIWDSCKNDYSLIAVRDHQILNALYPATNPRFIRLKVMRDRQTVGWAVLLNTQMSGHKQFGDMRVGTLVDCLAKPADARDVVACSRKVLEDGGSDLVISNQASQAWCLALRTAGFMEGPSNFPFFMSPKLAALLQPLEESAAGFHLNRGDGDGPVHL